MLARGPFVGGVAPRAIEDPDGAAAAKVVVARLADEQGRVEHGLDEGLALWPGKDGCHIGIGCPQAEVLRVA
eukprot:4116782-Prymnesium_polylepis.1